MQNIFNINTYGPYYVSRALVRSWLGLPTAVAGPTEVSVSDDAPPRKLNKQILFVSSISALVAMYPQHQSAYNASKAGLTMFGKVGKQPAQPEYPQWLMCVKETFAESRW
jgi:NAD(P)-dependent dehydrogenase (short-subunit alcohol dehydrogenase family)